MRVKGLNKILKYIFLPVLLIVFVGIVVVSAYGGVNYLQSRNLAAEGKSLIAAEKYDQAIEKYALAMSKWVPEKFKSKYVQGLELAQKRQSEVETYDKGIEYYDNEKWVEAKQKLAQIADGSKYYADAQEKINKIEDKLAQAEEDEKLIIQAKKVVTSTIPSTSTPVPTSNPNKDSICKNEAELYKNQQREQAISDLRRNNPRVTWSGNDWLANGFSQADLQYVIPMTQNIYQQALKMIESDVQNKYLVKYNECLRK